MALFAAQDTTLCQRGGHVPLGAVVTGSAWLHAWASSCNPFPPHATVQLPAISLQGSNDSDNDYQRADNIWPFETAHELPDPLVKSIEIQTLPFSDAQDQMLLSGTLSDAALINSVLSSPVTLTHLTSNVLDPQAVPLTTTFVSSDFNPGWYDFVGQFTAKSSGWHTIT